MLTVLTLYGDPVPNSAGIEGCGQSVIYGDKIFHYRVGKKIPENKAVLLSYEGGFAGRMHGERDFIIACYHENRLFLLEHPAFAPLKALSKY